MNWALEDTFFLMPNWKWLGLAAAIAIGFFLRLLLSRFFLSLKKSEHILKKVPPLIRYILTTKSSSPDAWIVVCFFWISAIQSLKLPDNLSKNLQILVKVWLAINILRWLYLACDALGKWLADLAAKTESTADDQLVPFAVKTAKVLVVVVGVLMTIQNFGVNVVSLLAGLGLGGLALALAAQDTAANLFGSITILMDRPFQVGDYIRVIGTEATVTDIGFRSTRLRTSDNVIVTIPNSVMAKEKIENLTQRVAIRIQHILGVTYATEEKQLVAFMDQLKYFLHQHPKTRKEDILVYFVSLGDFSLGIRMTVHAFPVDLKEELQIQEEILFQVMRLAKEHSIEFAFPTQTLLVEKLPQAESRQQRELT